MEEFLWQEGNIEIERQKHMFVQAGYQHRSTVFNDNMRHSNRIFSDPYLIWSSEFKIFVNRISGIRSGIGRKILARIT